MSPVRKYFRDLSITYKIVLIIFVTSGVSLAIAGASFVTYDVRAYKESLVKDLSVEADIIAANSTAALAFDDYDSASETLSALRLEDRILIAYLLSAEGLTFATYARDDVGDQHRKPVLREEGYAFQDDYLAVRRSIVFDGEILGHIYIESDLGGVRERIGNFVGTVAAISTTALIVVMLLTSRLQRIISGPMVVLAGVARDISRKKDYSVRAEKVANDEVGDLIDGFNEMLEQIEAQDAMLQNHRAELQDEVASQTAELRTVNERLLTSESRMRAIVEGTSSSTGVEFFDALVRSLANALETRWVLVGMCRPGGRVHTLALWNGEEVVRDMSYDIDGTPCEIAFRDDFFKVSDWVRERFPRSELLREWGARSFVGLALRDSAGRQIGILSALHDGPLPEGANDEALLRVYASRAAVELERLRVEADLQRSETHTRAILDSAADGIISINASGVIETFNAAAEQIFGYKAANISGLSVAKIFEFSSDSQRQAEFERTPTAILSRLVGDRTELSGRRRSREAFPMNMAVSEIRIGDQIGYTAIVRDVTREHELERMKSDFVSTVSHEIRTPLAAIISSAKILTRNGGKKAEVATKFSKIIVDEGKRLNRLINNLLDLSKIDAGKTDWELDEVDPHALVDHVVGVVGARAKESEITVAAIVPEDTPKVWVDSDRVLQVLTNLVDNAAKFTPAGGSIEVRAEQDGERYVRFAVIDSGIGIAPEQQDAVFDRFKQIGDVMTDKPQGTGLGLPICKEIVEFLGGKIWLESDVGKGCAFKFTLPTSILGKNADAETVASGGMQKSDQAARVLVVDDDETTCEVIAFMLRRHGFEVLTSESGGEALEIAKRERPAAITLDLMMPDISGFEILEQCRNDSALAGVPIVALSVLSEREHVDRALSLGADAYVSKPVDEGVLISVLQRLMATEGHEVLVINENFTESADIKSRLSSQGFSVMQVFEGRSGLELASRIRPELIILGAQSASLRSDEILEALRDNDRTESIPIVVINEEPAAGGSAEFFDGAAGRKPAASGNVAQLLDLIVERYAARSRMGDLLGSGESDSSKDASSSTDAAELEALSENAYQRPS
jgi:PAS domain S-box-containing protein